MGVFGVDLGEEDLTFIWRMTHFLESGKTSTFGRLLVYRQVFLITYALVLDMIGTSSNRTVIAKIDNVKNKRRVNGKGWVQAGWPRPGFKPDTGNKSTAF